jgi:hypothetical protein
MSSFSKLFDNRITRQYFFECSLGSACPICKGHSWYKTAAADNAKGYARIDLTEKEIEVLLKLLRGTEEQVCADWKDPHRSATEVLHAGLAQIQMKEAPGEAH